MEGIFSQFGIDVGFIVIGLAVLVIALLVVCIVMIVKVNRLNKRLELFTCGKNGLELEEVIKERFAELDIMQKIAEKHAREIITLKRQYRSTYTKIGIIKYDAFKEMGGSLSFALALLTDRNDGFVLNCVHSREGSYSYIKEVIRGESYIALAPEEKEAISQAVNMKAIADE